MEKKKFIIPRRGFFKVAGVIAGSLTLAACGISPNIGGSNGLEADNGMENSPEASSVAFFSLVTGINVSETPGLAEIIKNPLQRTSIMEMISRNTQTVLSREQAITQAIQVGNVIGLSAGAENMPRVVDQFINVLPGHGTGHLGSTMGPDGTLAFYNVIIESPNAGVVESWVQLRSADPTVIHEVGKLGTQPSTFPLRVTESAFIVSRSLNNIEGGGGFLGAVDQVIADTLKGTEVLKAQGVPDETVGYIVEWVQIHKGQFKGSLGWGAERWAEVGAKIQAHINWRKHGYSHAVIYGVQDIRIGNFEVLGIVDDLGVKQPNRKFPRLVGLAEQMNQQLAGSQVVKKNIVSVSQRSPSQLFGSFNQGEVFIVNHDAGSMTLRSMDELVAGLGYSIGSLEQGDNIIYLVADKATDMVKARQAVLSSSYYDDFINKGGLMVELMPDGSDLLQRKLVVRNLENPEGMVMFNSPAEEKLIVGGANKLYQAAEISKVGELIRVRVQATTDGKIYEIKIPESEAYGNLSAEVLEKYGIPITRSPMLEKAGVLLRKAGLVAGLVWMAYDGVSWVKNDLLAQGPSVQLTDSGKFLDFTDNELLQAIVGLGLENTMINKVMVGDNIQTVAGQFKTRAKINETLSKFGIEKPESYFLRLDDNVIGIPGILYDDDLAIPIEVTMTGSEIVYTEVSTGNKMVFQYNGTDWVKVGGSAENLSFSVPIKTSQGETFVVPCKFFFDDKTGKETVIPALEGINGIL